MAINNELLEILVCPACRGKVQQQEQSIVCTSCGRRYPIREDIPIMLINEALTADDNKQKEN
jgi:uncharacterized protein YbaR (Trm112 family)